MDVSAIEAYMGYLRYIKKSQLSRLTLQLPACVDAGVGKPTELPVL